MSFRVWRKNSDNSVVGYCEADYEGFEPGGDPKTFTMSIEPTAPTMPAPPPSAAAQKLAAVASDPTVPGSLKALLAELVR